MIRKSWVQVPPPEPRDPCHIWVFGGFVKECRDGLSFSVLRMCRDRFAPDPFETHGHITKVGWEKVAVDVERDPR